MILNRQRAVRVMRRPLEVFLRRVIDETELRDAGVTVCLVSDAEIARLNLVFRGKKGPTDVLSFPAGERRATQKRKRKRHTEFTERTEGTEKKRPAAEKYWGDIAIAPRTARRYAKKNGRSLSSELRVLILHGVLHLLGYDHETDRGEMDRIERKLRRRFGLA
jgi:probable rRNA maturation factor